MGMRYCITLFTEFALFGVLLQKIADEPSKDGLATTSAAVTLPPSQQARLQY